ncbi:hypothetical protein ANN_17321 [Periplaneta americana]|uniref:Uncharacterized protein n=1 Tax=Periplaneta americana TaxID=6978 RepID=A0ABQ8SSM8_PERAM|nr:hypothetical protein ANN_17321 [Periplaneta americana]
MSPGSSTESYPAFARNGLRENPGKNLNQATCPDRDSNPGHLVSRPDALTVTPQFDSVRHAAWSSDWIGTPVIYQKSIALIILISSKGFELKACNVVPVSYTTFMSRKIRQEGLQNSGEDRTVKVASNMLVTLAFVQTDDVPETFEDMEDNVQEKILGIYDYFVHTSMASEQEVVEEP